MKWRVVTFLVVTAIAVWSDLAYDRFHTPGRLFPREWLLGDTWYGVFVFLAVPLSLAWAALAAKWRWVRILGVIVAIVIALWIVLAMINSPLPCWWCR